MKAAVLGCVLATSMVLAASVAGADEFDRPAQGEWSFYVGGHAGYGFGDATDLSFPLSFDENPEGFVGGGHVGFNYQINEMLVVGIEGDFDGADIDGKGQCTLGATVCTSEFDWLASVRGRVGLTFDRFMLYATGGAAFTKAEVTATAGGLTTRDSESLNGFVVGGGVEGNILDNWTARVEALYYEFGSEFFTNGGNIANRIQYDTVVVRAGISIHLNNLLAQR